MGIADDVHWTFNSSESHEDGTTTEYIHTSRNNWEHFAKLATQQENDLKEAIACLEDLIKLFPNEKLRGMYDQDGHFVNVRAIRKFLDKGRMADSDEPEWI